MVPWNRCALIAAAILTASACSSGADPQIASTQAEAKKAPPPVPVQVPLAPSLIPKFVNQLPVLQIAPGGSTTYPGGLQTVVAPADAKLTLTLNMCEFEARVLPAGTPLAATAPGATTVWGYSLQDCAATRAAGPRDSYLGPVIAAVRHQPAEITFVNDLGTTESTHLLAWKLGTDQTLHWADPLATTESNMCAHHGMNDMLPMGTSDDGQSCLANYAGPIPAIPHLHGGEVPSHLDGGPEAWFTSDGQHVGKGFYSKDSTPGHAQNHVVFTYPNEQEPGPLWFHDHTLGATRLNVYAGLAGAYVLDDPAVPVPSLPPIGEMIPLVIQDRMFDTNGQLLFQSGMSGGTLWALNPDHPFWNPEFVGDTVVVNGKAWPNLNVEPRRYRFLFLNGSNARTYELFLIGGAGNLAAPKLWVVATDGGFIDAPVEAPKLVMMPGERYEVIVDFGGAAPGTRFVLKNTAKTPYPGGDTPDGVTLGQIMQFTVGPCASGRCGSGDTSLNPAIAGAAVRNPGEKMVKLVDAPTGTVAAGVAPAQVRQLTLNEVMGMPPAPLTNDVYAEYFVPGTGPLTASYEGGPLEILLNNTKWDADTTETPLEGSTEVWEIVNLTADSHPIHLHLVQFQILNRQDFDVPKYAALYASLFPEGEFEPGVGPPLAYSATGNVKAVPGVVTGLPYVGGNPDVTPFLRNVPKPPAPYEAGWKDTAQAPPGMVTRLVVRWAPTSLPVGTAPALLAYPFDPSEGPGYVWHCHIIDHEDNEMMRRTAVQANTAAGARSLVPGASF